jgi:hypothetical protein
MVSNVGGLEAASSSKVISEGIKGMGIYRELNNV